MKAIPVVNFLKLRASWGKLGNQGGGDNFPYIAKVGYSGANYVWGDKIVTGAKATSYGNPDIRWESLLLPMLVLTCTCGTPTLLEKETISIARRQTFFIILRYLMKQDSVR